MNKKHERSLLFVIYGVVLAALAVFIIRTIDSNSTPSKHSTKPSASHAANRPSGAKGSSSTNSSTNSFKSSSTAISKAADNLSNTGPGSTIEIYVFSSLVFGLLYYLSCYVRLNRKH